MPIAVSSLIVGSVGSIEQLVDIEAETEVSKNVLELFGVQSDDLSLLVVPIPNLKTEASFLDFGILPLLGGGQGTQMEPGEVLVASEEGLPIDGEHVLAVRLPNAFELTEAVLVPRVQVLIEVFKTTIFVKSLSCSGQECQRCEFEHFFLFKDLQL